jgi:hypothetical protein
VRPPRGIANDERSGVRAVLKAEAEQFSAAQKAGADDDKGADGASERAGSPAAAMGVRVRTCRQSN